MKNLIVVHGPNLNLLGEREPEIYGIATLDEVNSQIENFAKEMNIDIKCFQSNSEGTLIDFIHDNRRWSDGIVLNPGALTHYSYALRDAIASVNLSTVEVHLSNILKREDFRMHSVVADVCVKRIMGLGPKGYLRAVEFLAGLGVQEELKTDLKGQPNRDVLLTKAVKLLKDRFPKYSWVGIYLLQSDELVLYNYLGRPTPHERIPIGKGICGAAVAQAESIIVSDVKSDPRYLACSIETRSEIVVPIFAKDKIVGEIDIDSDFEDIFHDGDQEILEGCADVLGQMFTSK